MKHGPSNEVRERIRTLHAEGLTMSEIARELSLTKNSVIGLVHRMKLPARPSPIGTSSNGPKWTPEVRAEALALKLSGQSYSQLAERYGISPGAVVCRLKSALQIASGGERAMPRAPTLSELMPGTLIVVKDTPAPRFAGLIGECTYLVSDKKPWRYCDSPTVPGKSMCPEHHAICFRKHVDKRDRPTDPTPAWPHSSVSLRAA